ncbi:2-oxoglutarate-Fe(II) type oxidoreductase hxnY [Fusarium oxysporum f. sp. albedinis]|nr:2-oxoglutarate-Fe(II) type oxidoreductase hxnY [Fusarium oxysporum f. sp. albedinis]
MQEEPIVSRGLPGSRNALSTSPNKLLSCFLAPAELQFHFVFVAHASCRLPPTTQRPFVIFDLATDNTYRIQQNNCRYHLIVPSAAQSCCTTAHEPALLSATASWRCSHFVDKYQSR